MLSGDTSNPTSTTLKTFVVDTSFSDGSAIETRLMGHMVAAGTGYAGNLLCTGLTHWRVAELLSQFIGDRAHLLKGKRIAELGSGLGLCGIVAAKAVGEDGFVLLTDGDEEVINIAASNVATNGISNRNAVCHLLQWDDLATAKRLVKQYASPCSYSSSGSNTNDSISSLATPSFTQSKSIMEAAIDIESIVAEKNIGFDMVIASDCLYKDLEAAHLLFRVAALLLRKSNAARSSCSHNNNACDIAATITDLDISKERQESTNEDDDDPMLPTCSDCTWAVLPPTPPLMQLASTAVETLSPSVEEVTLMLPTSNDDTPVAAAEVSVVAEPVLVLGYTRRLRGGAPDMRLLLQAAEAVGFEWSVAEDGVVDVFGNTTSERTMLWEHCVFLFTFKK